MAGLAAEGAEALLGFRYRDLIRCGVPGCLLQKGGQVP